ncbi:MAG: M57 family metalloprotease [Prevotella sp.]|nr:M57 family metalloprotease [Prevotella sp.]
MKKIIYLSLILGIVFASCQKELDFTEGDKATLDVSKIPIEHQQIINQLGLDIATLVDKGDDYQLEGDIMLSKEEMGNYVYRSDSTGLKQAYVGGKLINFTKAQNITIRIDDASVPKSGIGSDWRQAVQRAINEWNNINGTCLNFIYTTASTADITVKRTASNDNAVAWTWLPSSTVPAKEIFVNSNYDNYQFKANTLIHEMGHSIGLLHAHEGAASQGGVIVPGTPEIDNASIMSYNRDRSLLPGFTNNDLVAVTILYPANPPYLKVEKPSLWKPNYKVTLVNYQAGGFSANATWSVTGGGFASGDPNSLINKLPKNSIEVVKSTGLGAVLPFTVTAYQNGRAICLITIN